MLYTFCYVTSSNKIKFTYWLPHFIGFEEIFWHNTSFLSVEIDKLKLFKTEQMSLLSSQTYRILWLRWSKRLESVWLIMIYFKHWIEKWCFQVVICINIKPFKVINKAAMFIISTRHYIKNTTFVQFTMFSTSIHENNALLDAWF